MIRSRRLAFQGVTVALLGSLLSACTTTTAARPGAVVRPPTAAERETILRAVDETWTYESRPEYNELRPRSRPGRPHLRPQVVRARVSRADPRFSSAVVELRDARGRRRGPAAVMVFQRIDHDAFAAKQYGAWVLTGPTTAVANACTAATPSGLRALVCPDPWGALDYPRPRVRAQAAYTQRIRSPDLHAVDWRKVALPGGVCGASRPIRPHDHGDGPDAFIRPDADLLWWNPVWVYSWTKPVFGDLDGDGRDEAAVDAVCANGGGTADGQLAFSEVIFKSAGTSLRVLGILTPRQPLDPRTTHVPLSHVVAIERGRVLVSEAWYGRYDGTCCASGRARTVWPYRHGRLRAPHTAVLERPWSSSLTLYEIVVEPAEKELDYQHVTRISATRGLRIAVSVNNEGDLTRRHVAVTLTVGRPRAALVETKTIREVKPWPLDPPTVVFRRLGRLPLGTRTTVKIEIHDHGANPLRFPVVFTRG